MGRGRILDSALNRRQFLAATGVTIGAAAVTLANTQCDSALLRRAQQAKTAGSPQHRAWVWQFSTDGAADAIAAVLAANKMAVMMKTHDGLDWMAKYDHAAGAISGPQQVATVAGIFERRGVPFHAWSVIKGIDPVAEAQMAADVLAAGARSLTLDLEPFAGFWVGSPQDATRFGDELRRRDPYGRVDISIDARPWRINMVPMRQFADFTDGIAPQLYWDTFDSADNLNAYRYMGYPPGPDGISPEFLLTVTQRLLAPYNRWIIPAGQGAAGDPGTWPRFAHKAWELQMPEVSAWRFGVTPQTTLQYLGANPAGREPSVPPPAAATATAVAQESSTPTPKASATPAAPTTPPTITPTNTPRPTRTPTPGVSATPTSTP